MKSKKYLVIAIFISTFSSVQPAMKWVKSWFYWNKTVAKQQLAKPQPDKGSEDLFERSLEKAKYEELHMKHALKDVPINARVAVPRRRHDPIANFQAKLVSIVQEPTEEYLWGKIDSLVDENLFQGMIIHDGTAEKVSKKMYWVQVSKLPIRTGYIEYSVNSPLQIYAEEELRS